VSAGEGGFQRNHCHFGRGRVEFLWRSKGKPLDIIRKRVRRPIGAMINGLGEFFYVCSCPITIFVLYCMIKMLIHDQNFLCYVVFCGFWVPRNRLAIVSVLSGDALFSAQFFGFWYEPPGDKGEPAKRRMVIVSIFQYFVFFCDTVTFHWDCKVCECTWGDRDVIRMVYGNIIMNRWCLIDEWNEIGDNRSQLWICLD